MKNINKILDLLSASEQKRLFVLFFLIFVMAFIEMMGVASILPFIAVLANPEIIETNQILNYLYDKASLSGVDTEQEFIFILGLAVFIFLIISLSLRALTTYVQLRFTLIREYSVGKRLIEHYLHQPYLWFLSRNSAELGKSILSEVNQVINGVMVPTMNLIAQCFVTFAILSLLFITDPVLAVSIGLVLIGSYGIIYILMKKFISNIGIERLQANADRFTAVNEAFNASKEVKLLGLEQMYIDRFSRPAKIYAVNQATAQVIAQLPRFLLEAVAFGGMILIILIMMKKGGEFSTIIPILALYAFAGYRLMPALQQIYNAITTLRFTNPSINFLHKELTNINLPKKDFSQIKNIKIKKEIKLQNVFFDYPGSKMSAISNINLNIQAFQKIGIVGATGSGKSTTVDIILGLLNPDKGNLVVDDEIINDTNRRSWQKVIGYVPQQIYLSDSSIKENIAFGVDKNDIDQNAIETASKIANLHDFVINELLEKYDTCIGEKGVRLSGGQRQRIGIARALYHNPQVLILDEATSSLDNITEKIIMESMNNLKNKITTILIAHRLTTVKNCDKIYFLQNGKIQAEDTYNNLVLKNKKFKKMASI
jgi:ATP-binding cassette, subfamily B, bacterial PglK